MSGSKRATRQGGVALAGLALCGILAACSDSRPAAIDGTGTMNPAGSCHTGLAGCSCDTPGVTVDCGHVKENYGDYVTCSMGTSTCVGNAWSACVGDRITQKSLTGGPGGGLHFSNVGGASAACPPGYDDCDPYCNQAPDDPTMGFAAPPGFSTGPGGLTLSGSASVACTSLTVTPAQTNVTVTSLTAPGSIAVTAAVSPAGCLTAPFPTTWSLDKPDQATMTGTTSATGSVALGSPLPGVIRVTAYAGGVSGFADITLKLNIIDTVGTSPDTASTATQYGKFYAGPGLAGAPLAGAGNTVTWLYPYANTYFPLALPAPVVMYSFGVAPGTPPASSVKMSLRYPAGTTEATSTFNYAVIIGESSPDPRVYVPIAAWQRFEQTARANDATLVVQRWTGGAAGTLETETPRTIHFVDGQLKGTVFYNSYSSPQGGNTGAVLSIAPGATTPTLAVQPSGRCTVCHSLNLDGSKLIANGTSNNTFDAAARYNISGGGFPAPAVLQSYNYSPGGAVTGDKFTFGGPRTDGSLYMSHGGSGTGDANWRAPPAPSQLFDPTSPATAKVVSGWPANMQAVTPRFSVDGSQIAFGYWGGTALNESPSGTLSSDSSGKILATADFTCNAACTAGWTVTNARPLTTTASPGVKVAWPAFTPDESAVVYQAQILSSKAHIAWSPSDINTVAGAQAELWISAVPPDHTTAPVPTRLNLLNGLTGAGANYLPLAPRTISPPAIAYHSGSSTWTMNQADNCGNTSSISNVKDSQLNYLPAMNPTEAGGKVWVVFTSRRMYGNIAYDDPWDAEPGQACSSGLPPTKKLWVAALDKTWTAGTEPSHPAFYLPGQELAAGNSNGYWVNTPCAAVNGSCTIGDDCCGGSGATPTTSCKITTAPSTKTCQNITGACVASGGVCNTAGAPGDCCAGLTCPGVGGTCFNATSVGYTGSTYTREYVATCPAGSRVKWRFFNWRSTTPAGTSVDFTAQTKELATDTYLPATALAIGSATSTTPGTTYAHGASTVDQVLLGATPALSSMPYLLVSMKFNANAAGTAAPSLVAWEQDYDCPPAE